MQSQAEMDVAHGVVTEVEERTWTAGEVGEVLRACPADYRVLLCDRAAYSPADWTDTFRVEIDPVLKVVRLIGDCS